VVRHPPGRAWVVSALVWAASAAGCAAEAPCGLQLCDIRQPGCQRAVGAATACLRGQSNAEVPMRVISQRQFIAESIAAGEGNVDKALFARWMEALLLFGLAAPGVDVAQASYEQAAWVAAFYDPGDRSITIIDRGQPLDTRESVSLLVHEYTHALQDRSVGLEAFRLRLPEDLDRFLASRAVTEGEATLIEDLSALGLFGTSEHDVTWGEVFDHWQDLARGAAATSKLPVDQSLGFFPYPFGLPYVHAAFREGGLAGVERLYAEPPLSSAQVLAGFGAPAGPVGAWAEELGAQSVPALPARYTLVDTDRLGGWIFEILLNRVAAHVTVPPELRRELADPGPRVRADRFSVFSDGQTGKTVACWRLRLSTPEAARAVARLAALDDLRRPVERGGWAAFAVDRDVVLLAGPEGSADFLSLATPELTFSSVPAPPTMMMTAGDPRARWGCPTRARNGPETPR
jgi:hypothetical protein